MLFEVGYTLPWVFTIHFKWEFYEYTGYCGRLCPEAWQKCFSLPNRPGSEGEEVNLVK